MKGGCHTGGTFTRQAPNQTKPGGSRSNQWKGHSSVGEIKVCSVKSHDTWSGKQNICDSSKDGKTKTTNCRQALTCECNGNRPPIDATRKHRYRTSTITL